MHLNKKDLLVIVGIFILLLICGIGSWILLGGSGLIVVVILSSVLILAAILESNRRLLIQSNGIKEIISQRAGRIERNIQQIEPLLSLFYTIRPQLPFPNSSSYSATPDFMNKLLEIVFREKPELVVEVGSGVSTLIIAYCLKQTGCGKVISLDHQAKYALKSQEMIAFHGLEEVATVVHAPLTEYEINGKKWLWYDTSKLQIEKPIDLLVIDGPPGTIQPLARYPALPLLYKHFGDNAIIIGDDGNRKDEKEIVERWRNEFRELFFEFFDLDKGAFLLSKQKK